MPADGRERDAFALIAALDPAIALRLLDIHPAAGWCRACRSGAPCSTRTMAEAAHRAGRTMPHVRP